MSSAFFAAASFAAPHLHGPSQVHFSAVLAAAHLHGPSHSHFAVLAAAAFFSPSDLFTVFSGRLAASVCDADVPASIGFGSVWVPPPQPRPSLYVSVCGPASLRSSAFFALALRASPLISDSTAFFSAFSTDGSSSRSLSSTLWTFLKFSANLE